VVKEYICGEGGKNLTVVNANQNLLAEETYLQPR